MDFNYSPEDESFRTEVRQWLEANQQAAPASVSILASESDEQWNARVRWHKKLNEGGWVAVNWPKEYGGRGATVMQRVIYREELARLDLNEPGIGMGIGLLGPTLMHWGTEEQKSGICPRSCAARKSGARATASRGRVPISHRCRRARSTTATIS